MGLPIDLSDTSILGTALAEAAAEESRHNLKFARDIHRRYDELMGLRATSPSRGQRQAQEPLPPLVAIRQDTGYHEIDPFKPPDPDFLTYVYGRDQLARALQDYTLDMLKRTAAELERKHPGTKPASRARKDAVIAYIAEYSGKE